MYEQFFGLSEKPFSIQPDPSFLYWGRTHRLAYAMLEYGVLNHAGISVITGEVGCGKTTLVHRLLDQLSDTHTVALLSNIQEGRGDLLSWVLMGFGEPFANKTHVELFSQLQTFFIGEYAKGKRVVMIIDEAQNLSADMLEELRMLSNINAGKDQLLQLILVGQPQLKDLLNKPELLQLAQRVGSDFHLTPLSTEEVHAYVETRLAIAGCRRRIFTDRAIDLISEQSRGVPRVINIIADTALVYAFSAEDLVVGVETIRNVIRDKSEFGVFGLASDKDAAPPMKPADDAGIDAFTKPQNKDNAPRLSTTNDVEPIQSGGNRRPTANTALPKEPFSENTQGTASAVKPIADIKTTVTTNVASKTERTATVEKVAVREEPSVTGIVVIASDKDLSPEAAIRSAGDGRAIIFVAHGNAPEATTIARKAGAVVVEDTGDTLNTGGRARNAGYRQLKKIAPHIQFVQFIDTNYALDPDWVSAAEKFMARRPEVSVVEGAHISQSGGKLNRSRDAKHNQHDIEGELQCAADGTVLIRTQTFEAAGGFRGDLTVAETEDLCIRLRRRGARVWRLDEDMAIGNAKDLLRGGWWGASVRRGYKNAYCASLHGAPPERLGVPETSRAIFWGLIFPVGLLVTIILSWTLAKQLLPLTPVPLVSASILAFGLAVYFLKLVGVAAKTGLFRISSWPHAMRVVFGATPEFFGAMRHWFNRKS